MAPRGAGTGRLRPPRSESRSSASGAFGSPVRSSSERRAAAGPSPGPWGAQRSQSRPPLTVRSHQATARTCSSKGPAGLRGGSPMAINRRQKYGISPAGAAQLSSVNL